MEAAPNDEPQEGWYTDPFGRHEARWLSDGQPTKLVRDAGVESYDEPPSESPTRVPERIVKEGSRSAGDLYRAEDAWGEGDTFTPSLGDSFLNPPPGRGVPKAFEEPP
jgi:hypothetical protein